ncbi:sensor histidine kinase [Sulfurimonas sp.]|uniref:sensor histidine kinase n=1 Tax=Sulfurimonas sp. TaxID=2022749 RepID=UPI0025CB84DB|nr:sensor histidine kinase [Sulfurimonas sp.]MBW6488478.1 ATP-binding protein [Sulfurimonas sp.]
MNNEWENVYFLSHVNIKNIIGKELINNDNVAVMELVKNSYDAGAKEVTVEFKNLKNQDRKIHEIIIADDGIGMSKEDILHKWLNLAYSIKRVQNAQNNRLQAGNKGIGRFSCDRLGKKLDIYTKKDNKAYHLRIDWEDFENVEDYNVQINQIPMKLKEVSDDEVYQDTAYKIGKNGTIIQMSYLRTKWVKFKEDSLFNEVLNYQKFVSLKSALEKLINKSQVESDNFKIFLKVQEIDDMEEDSYNKKINGEIENKFFEKLDFDTTYIHSAISEDGKYIITKLKDRDKVIFKTIEKNIEFPDLKGVKIILTYLNPYGKVYFKKQMGIRSVDFGSIYLFINGFRIPPYGDINNDSFGLEVRKSQGVRRNIGNREIIGRIEIEDRIEQYPIISSREGIVQNESFRQLIHQSTKSTKSQIKNNGFFYKTLKRLEKYVVEGLKWDSAPRTMTEATIEEMIKQKNWNVDKEVYLINREEKLNNISKKIFQIMNIDSTDIVDLDINDEVLSHLIEKDTLKTQKNITQFLKDFSKVPNYAVNEKTKQFVKKAIENIGDETLLKKVDFVLNYKLNKIDALFDKEESYKQLDKKIKILESEQENLIKELEHSEEKNKNLKKEIKKINLDLEQKKKHNAFQGSILGTEKKYIMGLQHQIKHSTSRIINNLQLFLEEKGVDNLNNDEKSFLKVISMESSKILSIANFITKANYNLQAKEDEEDIVNFINHYINEIYINESKIIDTDFDEIRVFTNDIEYKCKYIPLEITTIIDNFITNAENAKAKNIFFEFLKNDEELLIKIQDDGKGISSHIIDKIFDFGFTTTEGSGIGLYNVKSTIENMNGSIFIESNGSSFSTFLIRINNELRV